jgi:recombinational DNA repair ATPase RecF
MSLRIIGLQVENFKKIKVLALKPKSNVIKVTGGNASGKTSTLDAIQLALVGARGGPTAPVRQGAGRGQVKIDLGDFIVTRMWSEGGDAKGEMWIEAKDGMQYPSPQKVLDNLMGKISFDPLAFTRMEPKAMRLELRKLLGVDEALDELKAQEQADYQTRRERNTVLEQLVAQRKGLDFPEGLPSKPRDIDAMTQELADAAKFNVDVEREKTRRDELLRRLNGDRADISAKSERITELKKQLRELEAELVADMSAEKRASDAMAKLPPLGQPKNAQTLSDELAAARAVNQAIERKLEAEAKDAEIKRVSTEVAKLSRAIDGHRQKQADIIARAKFPVAGLGFSDDGVTYNGLPFEQASNAEQIKVSIAMGMVGNPKLRVMRIKDGSLLDDDSMAMVEKMAEDEDFQIWLELVDTTGKVGVYLVDGEIASVDGAAPPSYALAAPLGTPRKRASKREGA